MPRTMSLPRRPRGDDGAGTVEYVGVIMLVVALMLSLTVYATPVGNVIMARICEAFGAECGGPALTAPDGQPDKVCTRNTTTAGYDLGLSIAFVDLDGGGQMIVEEMSDGTYRVTLDGKASAEVVASAGEAVGSLSINGYGGSLELSASASAGIVGQNGLEFTFATEGAKNDFTGWVERNFVRGATAVAAGPLLAPAVGLGGWIYDKVTGYDYTPPAPSAIYGEVGYTGGAGASAGGIVAGGNASVEASATAGMKHDVESGETTVYHRVNLSAEGALQIGFSSSDANWGSGASGSGDVELVVGTVYSADGEVVGVSLDGAATAEGSYALTSLAGFPLQGEGGRGVQLSVEVPVTDANRHRILPTLVGLGAMATTAGSHPLASGTALPRLMEEAQASGANVTAQTLDVSKSELFAAALSLKAPAVGGLGFRASAGSSEQNTLGAYYADLTGWKPWTNCVA